MGCLRPKAPANSQTDSASHPASLQYGSCELKRSAELAAGQAPIYGNSGIDVVPVLAGFNVPVPDSEAGAATAATATPAGETLVGTAGR